VGSRPQAATSLNNASLYQVLVLLAHCGKQLGAWHDAIFTVFGRLNDYHAFHFCFSFRGVLLLF
jgi:hypothetical protein